MVRSFMCVCFFVFVLNRLSLLVLRFVVNEEHHTPLYYTAAASAKRRVDEAILPLI